MIAINKAESEAIRNRFPTAHIVRTLKQKSKRHHYYCEETRRVLNYLEELRTSNSIYVKDGVGYTAKKKARRNST